MLSRLFNRNEEPHWVVQVHGTDISILFDGHRVEGFYTTRAVAAASSEEAVATIFRQVREELTKFEQAQPATEPRLEVESIHSISAKHARKIPKTGFSFYSSDEDEDEAGPS